MKYNEQNIYNQIKMITEEIGRLNLAAIFLDASHTHDYIWMKGLLQIFKERKIEQKYLWKNLDRLISDYEECNYPVIFKVPKDIGKGYINYDETEINPISLMFLCVFAEGKIQIGQLFEDEGLQFANCLTVCGLEKYGDFLRKGNKIESVLSLYRVANEFDK